MSFISTFYYEAKRSPVFNFVGYYIFIYNLKSVAHMKQTYDEGRLLTHKFADAFFKTRIHVMQLLLHQ